MITQFSLKIKASIATLTGLLALSLVIMSCTQQPGTTSPATTPTPMAVTNNTAGEEINQKLVAANTRFGFKLFSQIQKKQASKNVFISPSSVAMALTMAYNGSSGETQKAMTKALELQGLTLEEINKSNLLLKQALTTADPQIKLAIANSLWANQQVTLNPDFIQKNQQYYDAEISKLNFSDPASVGTINNWVKKQTNGKITEIVDQLQPDQILWLINAIYFKGNWSEPFAKEATKNRPFTLLNGSKKQHPLMSQSDRYQYLENDQFQAISLPYGNGQMSFYVFLPKSGKSLDSFYNSLNAQTWEQWMKQFRSRQGSISLPRFKLEYDISLNEALKALGMAPAFNRQQADFSGMSNVKANIDEVKHKTFVEVNEEGTEAAAVTGVGIRTTSAPARSEPFEMVVDRPFFSVIRDNKTGTILFMGSIVDPQ
ncbi:serpin family protein [Ancylothrix sp. C2]|uniref:serpin family protein n=1 Tax=Ancylothrix sp. D3o TaxID=2953691 RepID=UPI0021BB2729|nr:serpin family protein [Ancylothrix sp. D3o]MCT7950867.1 serpin family protein [Ancylothrix sp. D3o]